MQAITCIFQVSNANKDELVYILKIYSGNSFVHDKINVMIKNTANSSALLKEVHIFFSTNTFTLSPDNLKNGRFHQHLRETFAPMVVRYVDLMESSIAQSIHKGFEKERWENKGLVWRPLVEKTHRKQEINCLVN